MNEIAVSERNRLDDLDSLDWPAMRNSSAFETVLSIARIATGAETVLLNLIGEDRQETVASLNWSGPPSIDRNTSICTRTMIEAAMLEIPDLALNPHYSDHPAVVGDPHLRFYAGAPVITRRGHCVGALCVLDTKPRALSELQTDSLRHLAEIASELLEVHRTDVMRARAESILRRQEADAMLHLYQRALDSSSNAVIISDATDPDMGIIYVNPAFEFLTGYSLAEVRGRNCRFLQGDDTQQSGRRELRSAIAEQRDGRAVMRNFRKDESEFWVDVRISPVRDAERVTHFVGFQVDVTDRIRHERDLAHLATHDALTGLPNRTLMKDRLQQALDRHQLSNQPFAVAFIDLDRFKLVNDSLGHSVGDELLRLVGERLKELVGNSGTVARMGGDEFVLILTGFESNGELMERVGAVHRTLRQPRSGGEDQSVVEASIGVAFCPEHGLDAGELLRNADAAMYAAKSQGRGNSQVYRPTLTIEATEKLALQSDLHKAIERGEFVLHYQPQFFREGPLCGLEALIRWNHPSRGLLLPSRFIDAAEEFGLIDILGNWVLGEACRQNKAWQDADLFHVPVAVNVSVTQFRKSHFIHDVEQALRISGLAARYLDLEITETTVMDGPERMVDLLHRLRRLGTKTSIDDFGTGHSSLSFIRRFALDALKIDKSFVRDITTDPAAAAICDTIIRMAHNLGLRVVAEGVETVEQAEFLREHFCDALQGYLFSAGKSPTELIIGMMDQAWAVERDASAS